MPWVKRDPPMSSATDEAIRTHLLLILVLAISTLVAFLLMERRSYWLDEVFSVSFVQLSWSELWAILRLHEAHIGLYYVLLKLWTTLFGVGEVGARSLSALFAVGGVLMTYAVGSRLFRRDVALIAAYILAVNGRFVRYAQEARAYSLVILLVTAGMYVFILGVQTNQTRYFVLHSVITAVAIYAHLFAVFVLFAQIASLFFLPRDPSRWRRMLLATAGAGILVLPLSLWVVFGSPPGFEWNPPLTVGYVFRALQTLMGQRGKILKSVYVIACLIALARIIQVVRHHQNRRKLWSHMLVVCWFLCPIVGLLALSAIRPFFAGRYLVAALPALALIAGLGIAVLPVRLLKVAATAALMALSLVSIYVTDPLYEMSDWRSATGLIVENAQQGDGIIFYSHLAELPFQHYYMEINKGPDLLDSIYPHPLGSPIARKVLLEREPFPDAILTRAAQKYDRLWLLLAHDDSPGMGLDSTPIVAWMDENWETSEFFDFGDIEIRLYQGGARE